MMVKTMKTPKEEIATKRHKRILPSVPFVSFCGYFFFWCLLGFLLRAGIIFGQDITIQDLRNGFKDPSRWLSYSGDYTSQRHSPLTQITPANVNRLAAQWTFQTDLSPFMSTGRRNLRQRTVTL